jgi:sterol desaturase/sphingolipid hydroxylase (fatty acid hydroxylase superfamily)
MIVDDSVTVKTAIVAAVFAILFVSERLAPAARPPNSAARLAANGALWVLVLLISPLVVLPLTAFAAERPLWERGENTLLSLAFDVILLDLWTYWLHRAYHETPLWRLHAPHHLDEHLDTTTAFRFHAGEVALSAMLRMAPIIVLAVPFDHVVAFETLLLAASMFHHSNVRLPRRLETALSKVIVTPSIHWVHHHAVRSDTDSNYAAILRLWDQLFGTRSRNVRERGMKIGVEGFADRSLWRLLLTPLKGRVR